ncbi:MAG: YidC/Oxa1 family membrane protein insertase [Clostridia bacterium]|nr:YidC/Oxa1 family membrane protein insertase [Clostridia bacterium]
MLNLIAGLFGYLMNFICYFVSNYGIAIILFTILVKLLLVPMTIKQQKSLEQTQKLQPLVQELQKKYGNNQQKFAEEYQKMLKENNTTMLGSSGCTGCLLSLIQIPIILAMFYMMASPLTHIMKMDDVKINEYKEEIIATRKAEAIALLESTSGEYTSEEYTKALENLENATYLNPTYSEIEVVKENELMDLNFLGINLGDVAANNKDNYKLLVIPILSALFTYLSVAVTNWLNKKKGIVQPKPEDSDIPMPDMRIMNATMPIMLGVVAYSVPQGVGLYWATSNFLGIVQTLVMNYKVFKKEKKMLNEGTTKKK